MRGLTQLVLSIRKLVGETPTADPALKCLRVNDCNGPRISWKGRFTHCTLYRSIVDWSNVFWELILTPSDVKSEQLPRIQMSCGHTMSAWKFCVLAVEDESPKTCPMWALQIV